MARSEIQKLNLLILKHIAGGVTFATPVGGGRLETSPLHTQMVVAKLPTRDREKRVSNEDLCNKSNEDFSQFLIKKLPVAELSFKTRPVSSQNAKLSSPRCSDLLRGTSFVS